MEQAQSAKRPQPHGRTQPPKAPAKGFQGTVSDVPDIVEQAQSVKRPQPHGRTQPPKSLANASSVEGTCCHCCILCHVCSSRVFRDEQNALAPQGSCCQKCQSLLTAPVCLRKTGSATNLPYSLVMQDHQQHSEILSSTYGPIFPTSMYQHCFHSATNECCCAACHLRDGGHCLTTLVATRCCWLLYADDVACCCPRATRTCCMEPTARL